MWSNAHPSSRAESHTISSPCLALRPEEATDADHAEAVRGRATGFREDTRDQRIAIARDAEHRFERKVAWAVTVGDQTALSTHVAASVMTRPRQPERHVLARRRLRRVGGALRLWPDGRCRTDDGAMIAEELTAETGELVSWLMEGDPAIRWQVLRDLRGEPEDVWSRERSLVGTTGWGAQLLSFQDDTGRWTPKLYGHKWISTTYSMLLLWRMGLEPDDPRAARTCQLFLADEPLWGSDLCISGMVLALLSWFDVDDSRREDLVCFILDHQMTDGGWNCQWQAQSWHRAARHSSFHTTINVLEGLRAYDAAGGARSADTRAAEAAAREFLLRHRLFRSHTTGESVDPRMTRLSFPPRWRYDILRSLDYYQSARAQRDDRMIDAVEVLTTKRRRDGRWPLQQRYQGRTWFEMEQIGRPSRWNTLRARRVVLHADADLNALARHTELRLHPDSRS